MKSVHKKREREKEGIVIQINKYPYEIKKCPQTTLLDVIMVVNDPKSNHAFLSSISLLYSISCIEDTIL